ncbi:P-loop containing nucleoside triphosphate hydrolase protein [Schizophyllum commune]
MSLRTRLVERDAPVKNKAPSARLVILALKTPSAKALPDSGLLSSTHKRSKAAFSGDTKPIPLNSHPTTPARDELSAPISEKDVSNVDPEELPLDYQTIEPGDVSAEIDPAEVNTSEDKVMVSNPPQLVADFTFDDVLTGTPNKLIYTAVGRAHVHAAMEGFNAFIFVYGQTASRETFTLTGGPTDRTTGIQDEPGIIPRSTRDIFGFIKHTPSENTSCGANVGQIQGNDITLTPLREEVITSLKSVTDVLKRGEANRRTASTDWNERS